MTIDPVSFKGVYKVTLPNVKEAKDKKEEAAFTDVVMNTVVMAANTSVGEPKVNKDKSSIYFKIDDKLDTNFENGFKSILENCNKQFNIDMAKKAYIEKVSNAEYDSAESL